METFFHGNFCYAFKIVSMYDELLRDRHEGKIINMSHQVTRNVQRVRNAVQTRQERTVFIINV